MLLSTKIKHTIKLLTEIESEGALIFYNNTKIPESGPDNEMALDELYHAYLHGTEYLEIHLIKKEVIKVE